MTVFAPLGGGLLAGEEALSRRFVGDARWGFDGFSDARLDLARRFNAIAREWGIAPAPLALAWLTARPAVSSAIIGPESLDELDNNAVAGDLALDPGLSAQLDSLGRAGDEPWY
jgi:aryl-alcohol dehydrogenase-like predicted oxidoreductase